jgi:hypothetical protein
MNIYQVFLILSVLLGLCSPLMYSYEILKGKAKPHRTTRFVILVITGIAFLSLLAQQNTVAVWLAGVGLLQSTLIFILSIKYGMGGWEKLDLLCLGIAGLGIVVWQITKDPVLALYASILADFTGFFPTLVKTYKQPQTESFWYFFLNLFVAGFNGLAIQGWTIQNASYPAYLTIMNALMIFLVVRPKLMEKKSA